MAASRMDIERWFDTAVDEGATHMIVVCDTFEMEDYPVYVMPGENVHEIEEQNSGPNMTRVMEVYSMKVPKVVQMAEYRAFHYN